MSMKRIFHHCDKWEETPMWQPIADDLRAAMLSKAKQFTGNAALYGQWMLQALERWPISCEHNLSNRSVNRQAWIGHAATFIAIGSPEDVTREAWGLLTEEQQDAANAKADEAIAVWERNYEAQ